MSNLPTIDHGWSQQNGLLDAVVESWVKALAYRSRKDEQHSWRVAALAIRLARAMGFPESEVYHIRRGALLHDIGKIAIPDAILLKPGPLTDEEMLVVRQHPIYAYEMLGRIEGLQPALVIPLYHHECWDGSGYPRGLKGEEIPLPARIHAVVAVWDALTSARTYRPALSFAEAVAIVRQGAGQQFDPQIVETFLKLIETDQTA